MFEPNTLEHKPERQFLATRRSPRPSENKQQRLMVGALVLLLAALGVLLYHDRDFWFPETQEAEEQSEPGVAATGVPSVPRAEAPASVAKKHSPKPEAKEKAPAARSSPPADAAAQRTVLPPLEVEVVAGDSRRVVHSGSNSVHVDLQAASPPEVASPSAASGSADTAAAVTSNAAERVQMSAQTAEVVSHSVRPGYPLLARQMRVQGSVILQALIGRDGAIQDLHVLSGPPILAGAAQEAVKQWRFKPHFQAGEAVETQARITVNFTISTY